MLYLKILLFITAVSSIIFFSDAFKSFFAKKGGPIATSSQTIHPAASTVKEFYSALEGGDCAKSIQLRPGYTLARCNEVSKVAVSQIKLEVLGENTAIVYVDVQFELKNSDAGSKFKGNVKLDNKNGQWLISEDFTGVSQGSDTVDNSHQKSIEVTNSKLEPIKPIAFDQGTSDFLFGKFEPARSKKFSKIDSRYASRDGMYLDAEAYESFKKMHRDAAKAGVRLVIKSATRNFVYQKGIWEGKWTGSRKVEGNDLSRSMPDSTKRAYKILENSSMPGSSRHHWGTDIDLNAFDNDYFSHGQGKKEYDWLRENAHKYHYCQPYSSKNDEKRSGYNEEKWHWSYMPLSKDYLAQSKTLMKNEMFSGFLGSEAAIEVDIVGKYVFGISRECR